MTKRGPVSVFISYRREDAAPYAGRICDQLSERFGDARVFMDVEGIAPGQDFTKAIEQTVGNASVVLAVIGPRWAEILKAREASSQEDFVRHEIAAALRGSATVIPILVGGASPTQLSGLAGDLAQLPLHQAVELRDASFKEDCDRLAAAIGPAPSVWQRYRLPFLLAAGLVLLGVALYAGMSVLGIGPFHAYRERQRRVARWLSVAGLQMQQEEAEHAFRSFQEALKVDPSAVAAEDGEVDAAMRWLENFHVLAAENQKAEDIAAPILAELMPVLDSGLARTDRKGSRAADILAHIGWAHWLNEKMAFKEFGGAKTYFQQALSIQPTNVYANAMYGNMLLQTRSGVSEAQQHFTTAVATGKERPLVRKMQIGGLWGDYSLDARTALFQALNDMRLHAEPFEGRNYMNYYDPIVNDDKELHAALSAVAPEESWQTFLWLEKASGAADEGNHRMVHDFVHATILEIENKRSEALAEWQALASREKTAGYSEFSAIVRRTKAAVRRLSA